MGRRLSFDTSFLIDFQRERRRTDRGTPAHDFLRANPDAVPTLSAVALGEFAEGLADPAHPLMAWVRSTHEVLPIDESVALRYGSVTRRLRERRQLIGSQDLWIAATALHYGVPLVTANERHFARVDGLEVLSYR